MYAGIDATGVGMSRPFVTLYYNTQMLKRWNSTLVHSLRLQQCGNAHRRSLHPLTKRNRHSTRGSSDWSMFVIDSVQPTPAIDVAPVGHTNVRAIDPASAIKYVQGAIHSLAVTFRRITLLPALSEERAPQRTLKKHYGEILNSAAVVLKSV